jgi:hypothetical protein
MYRRRLGQKLNVFNPGRKKKIEKSEKNWERGVL